jgi:lysophospholipase L1-like esterase
VEKLSNGGIVGNGYTVTSTYVTGGMFSLDGIHLSPRGYAVIANLLVLLLIQLIHFDQIDLSLYRILYPASL